MRLKKRYPLAPLRTPDKRAGAKGFVDTVEQNIAAIIGMSEALDELASITLSPNTLRSGDIITIAGDFAMMRNPDRR